MTFVVMLLSSLYEPETKVGWAKCMAHPFEKHSIRKNEFSDYGADMNVLFTFYKCRDDWADDKKVSRLAYSKLLKRSFRSVCIRYQEKAKKIGMLLREMAQEEKRMNQDIDHMAGLFGQIMGEILAVREDEWKEGLKRMGNFLGKFIYLMDAYEDIEEDMKRNRYNPLRKMYERTDFEEEIKTILTMMMAGCCREFEKLPVIEHAEILRNILYSGVWYRYEMLQQKREQRKEDYA